MSVLMWEKPKKVKTKEEWAENQADGAPPGTFAPNMSPEDEMRWKAKLVGHSLGYPQVEIRRNGVVIIVSTKGYKYGSTDCRQTPENIARHEEHKKRWKVPGDFDKVVHVSMNGSQAWSWTEFNEFQEAINEALVFLAKLDPKAELP